MQENKQTEQTLRVNEMFYSLQGESRTVGLPTVFIRLTGCPLRCQYCDTEYAFKGGERLTIAAILAHIGQWQAHYVTVTGGEPLAQRACLDLLSALCEAGYEVSLETSGALDVSQVDSRVIKVVDLKTPASGEMDKNHWENIPYLQSKDQIKFVVCDRDDYEWSKAIMKQYALDGRCEVLFSPSHTELQPKTLADWILQDHLDVRFQLQLHKYLWGDQPGH